MLIKKRLFVRVPCPALATPRMEKPGDTSSGAAARPLAAPSSRPPSGPTLAHRAPGHGAVPVPVHACAHSARASILPAGRSRAVPEWCERGLAFRRLNQFRYAAAYVSGAKLFACARVCPGAVNASALHVCRYSHPVPSQIVRTDHLAVS